MESGILKPEWDDDHSLIERDSQVWWGNLLPGVQAKIAMGLAWEQWYIPTQLPEIVDHPGEYCTDGIYMTPDGEELTRVILDRWGNKIHEIKFTFKSIKTVCGPEWQKWTQETFDSERDGVGPLSSQWMWMAQCKGYCYSAQTNYCDLHVCFAMADYRYRLEVPPVWRYSLTFTDNELADNWDLMTAYRDHKQAMSEEAANEEV